MVLGHNTSFQHKSRFRKPVVKHRLAPKVQNLSFVENSLFQVLGIDSEFCNVEALITGLVDNYPETLLKHRRLFTVGMCFVMFCLGVPMCTNVSPNEYLGLQAGYDTIILDYREVSFCSN